MDYTSELIAGWKGRRLQGKRAVVTGAGRGIGKAVALMFAAQGARTLASDISSPSLARLETEAAAAGVVIEPVAADLTTEAGAAEVAQAAGGAVHALVNAAAITAFAPIESMSFADWKLSLAGELDTVFLVTRALWSALKPEGASIVNFSSANAHMALPGLPAIAHCAGKGGVMAMTRQMALEGGPFRIRANSIAPGFILTEETARHRDNKDMMSSVRSKLMIDRLGEPEDIAWLAVYLASEESRFVTAADLSIDGGATAF